ncbi:MAG: hypothetical protein N2170_00680 [Bacteroidia bacterium]|nr:hypothetical protein [Bacteroidia bacterium]
MKKISFRWIISLLLLAGIYIQSRESLFAPQVSLLSEPSSTVFISVSERPNTPPKLSWWKKVQRFIHTLLQKVSDEETLSLVLGVAFIAFGLFPVAILIVGIIRNREDWILHFILNVLVTIAAWALFFLTCGLGVWITITLLAVCLIHALWYVITRS